MGTGVSVSYIMMSHEHHVPKQKPYQITIKGDVYNYHMA